MNRTIDRIGLSSLCCPVWRKQYAFTHHVELAQYADNTAVAATSSSVSLHIWECKSVIIVAKSRAMLFAETARRNQKPWPTQVFGQSKQWVKAARYLQMIPVTLLSWTTHTNQGSSKTGQAWLSPWQEMRHPSDTVPSFISSSFVPLWVRHALSGGPLLAAMSESCNQRVITLRLAHLAS